MKRYTLGFSLLFICFVCIPAMLPLFHPGFFPMHDDEQVGRLYELDFSLRSGEFPVRLAQDLGYGYDYPLFNFYPSLVYYIAEIFHLFGFSFIVSIKMMIGLGFLLAAFGIFFFIRRYFGALAGLLAAVAYTYAPYHSVDVYVRGALPEFWSFVFIPYVFWLFALLKDRLSFTVSVVLAFCLAGFLYAHNLIFLMATPFLLLFFLYLLWASSNRRRFFILSMLSVFLAAGLTSFFWLPELLEKQFTLVNLLTTQLANYNLHFVYFPQFWDTFWGYGGSVPGPIDGLSFQLGRMHLLLLGLSAIFSCICYCTGRYKKIFSLILLFWFCLFISLLLQTFYTKFVWDSLNFALAYIQFPWRYLTFSAFFVSCLISLIVTVRLSQKIRIGLLFIASAGILLLTFQYFQPVSYLSHATDSDYIATNILRWKTSNLSFEYVPNGVKTKMSSLGNTVVDINEKQIAKDSFTILQGKPLVKVIKDVPQEKVFTVNAGQSDKLQLNIYSFPGWKVYIDDTPIQFSDNDPLKLIQFALPSGEHTIMATFSDTPVRMIGNSLSIISFICAILLLGLPKMKGRINA